MQIGLLFIFLFATFHFGFALPLPGGIFLPQVAMVGVMAVMLWRRPDPKVIFTAAFASALLLLLVILASDSRVADPLRRALSGGQLIYTLTICAVVATARPFAPEQAKKLSWMLIGAAAAVTVFGLLEIFTPLSAVSDTFRYLAYPYQLVYDSALRDIGLAGFIRPKVFTPEPSQAAWSICLLVLCALACWPTRRNFAYGFAILGFATLVFVSPNTVVTLLFVSMAMTLLHANRAGISQSSLWIVIVALIIGTGATLAAADFLSVRFNSYTGYEGSLYIRVIQPFELTWLALKYNAAVGVGYGGLEAIWNQITLIDGGSSAENLNRTPGMALLTIPLYAGLSGLFLFALTLFWIYLRNAGRVGLACVAVLLFTLLQKQSFVITTAWVVAACWILQLASSLRAVEAQQAAKQAQTQQRREAAREPMLGRRRQVLRT